MSTNPKTDNVKPHTGERTPSLCMTASDGNKIPSAGSLTWGESKNHWLPSGLTGRAHQPPFQSANMARKVVYSPVTTCLTCCTLAEAGGSLKTGTQALMTSFCPSAIHTGKTLKCAARNWSLWNSLCRGSHLFLLLSEEKPFIPFM